MDTGFLYVVDGFKEFISYLYMLMHQFLQQFTVETSFRIHGSNESFH